MEKTSGLPGGGGSRPEAAAAIDPSPCLYRDADASFRYIISHYIISRIWDILVLPPHLMMPFPSLFLVTSPPRLVTSLPPLPADLPPRCGSSPLASPLFLFRPELEPAYSYYYEELGG